ncbi:MAG: hypothetical protein ACRESZ_07855, partial [Methylococcales bacterium]
SSRMPVFVFLVCPLATGENKRPNEHKLLYFNAHDVEVRNLLQPIVLFKTKRAKRSFLYRSIKRGPIEA